MLELAKKVLAMTSSASAVEYHPLPADDPVRRRPDITLARELLGWSPTVDFHEGLRATVEYFRGELAELSAHDAADVKAFPWASSPRLPMG